jgi:hypothetical protein
MRSFTTLKRKQAFQFRFCPLSCSDERQHGLARLERYKLDEVDLEKMLIFEWAGSVRGVNNYV